MDLAFSEDDDEFRDEVRAWLAEHAPTERRPHELHAAREYDLAWQRRSTTPAGPGSAGRWTSADASCRSRSS